MKHYIDFEASEALQKIISVGCVREDGEEFYLLVYTDDPITPRIEEITGITQEDIDDARSIDDVFTEFYDWCNRDDEVPEFICYGDGDYEFVSNTFYDASSFKAASMLGYIYLNMSDCSDEIKRHFYVNKTISLEKLARYFDPDFIEQNHNALDDAKLLKIVYEGMKKDTNASYSSFTEYLDPRRYPDEVRKVLRMNGNTVLEEFKNIKEAVEWVKKQPNDKGPQYVKDAAEKIKKAAKDGGKYFKSNWRIL